MFLQVLPAFVVGLFQLVARLLSPLCHSHTEGGLEHEGLGGGGGGGVEEKSVSSQFKPWYIPIPKILPFKINLYIL